ncbi:shikimate dehydrogenase [Desulfocurvus sp. DL9XJH121]
MKHPLYGIVGHPLGHSMSPALHNWALKERGLPGEYRAFPTPPGDLPAFMERVRAEPVAGLSVTIPHKLAVLDFVDGTSERVRAVGAANTLYWRDGRLLAENTDVHGFLAPLSALGEVPASALVLGAGGAARAALAGLRELGTKDVAVSNRNPAKAEVLAAEFKAQAIPWEERADADAALVVNATPLGMRGEREALSPWPDERPLRAGQTAYDLVYNPVDTVFLGQARAAGCRAIDGLTMFLHQALEQFRLFTGQSFDLSEARILVSNLLK